MRNAHHNQTYHENKIKVTQLLSEAIRLKDESASELNLDKSNALARAACDNFKEIHRIFNSSPILADDLRDHPNLYEITHFARKCGY